MDYTSDKKHLSPSLKPRHRMFILNYFRSNFNGAAAARMSGYSPKCARQIAWRLIHRT